MKRKLSGYRRLIITYKRRCVFSLMSGKKDLIILPFSSRKANKSNKMKRIIDPSENVYLIQLSWKGAGRFILEDKDKLANEHGTLTETYSEPLGAKAGLSPSLRRQSRYVFVNWRLVQNVKIFYQIFMVRL